MQKIFILFLYFFKEKHVIFVDYASLKKVKNILDIEGIIV